MYFSYLGYEIFYGLFPWHTAKVNKIHIRSLNSMQLCTLSMVQDGTMVDICK